MTWLGHGCRGRPGECCTGLLMSRLLAFIFFAASLWGQTPPKITRILQTGNNANNITPGAVVLMSGTDMGSAPRVSVNGVTADVYGAVDTTTLFRIPSATPV